MDISKLENANVMVIWKYTHNDVVSTTSRKTECKIDWKGGRLRKEDKLAYRGRERQKSDELM